MALAAALGLVLTACGGGGSKKEVRRQPPATATAARRPRPTTSTPSTATRSPTAAPAVAPHRDPAEPELPPPRRHAARQRRRRSKPLMPSLFTFDAESTPSVNKNYLESAELTAQEPAAGRHLQVQPQGRLERRHADWRRRHRGPVESPERHQPRLQDLVQERLRADRERGQGRRRPGGDRHLQAALRRLEGAVLTAVPGVDQQRPEGLQRGLDRQDPRHRRPVQVRGHRRDGQDPHPRPRRQVVGRPGQARPDHLPGHRRRRPHRRADQRRDRLHRRRARREQAQPGQDGPRRHHPQGRRPELPAHHRQRDGPDPEGREGPPGAGPGHRPRLDRQDAARPARGRRQAAPEPPLHGQPEGLQGQRRRAGHRQCRRSQEAARRGGLDGPGRGPQEGRQGTGHPLRDPHPGGNRRSRSRAWSSTC